MQPREISWKLAAAVDNGICASQTPGAAGNLTIAGSLATAGIATLTNGDPTARTGGCSQRRVILTFAADETGHNFTVYGTRAKDAFSKNADTLGDSISETVAGTTAGVVATLQDFATVTRVAIDAAATGAIKVGTNGVGASPWIPSDKMGASPLNIGFAVTLVSGSVNYGIQHTLNKLPHNNSTGLAPNNGALPNVFDHSSIVAQSSSKDGNYAFYINAFRLVTNSGTGLLNLSYGQFGVEGN